MSTSFISHAFGLQGSDYVRQSFVGGHIRLRVRPKARLVRCPKCKSVDAIKRGKAERWLRTVPIGLKPVWLAIDLPRVQCRKCDCVRRIETGIAEPRRWYTKAFEGLVITLANVTTMLDVAKLLGIGWDCVKDILKRHLKRRFGKPRLSKLKYIAIDEISIRKGHKYVTLVMDIKSGAGSSWEAARGRTRWSRSGGA